MRLLHTCCLLMLLNVVEAQYPSNYTSLPVTHNFVRTYSILKPGMTLSDITNSVNPQEVQLTTQFYDGLGRPMQTVVRQGSLNSAGGQVTPVDLVSPQAYNDFGLEQYKYMPYPSSESNGNFKGSVSPVVNPFLELKAFYDNSNPLMNPIAGQGESFYYSKTNFEPSPLNRVAETFAPGINWAGTEGTTNARSVKMGYYFNTPTDAVRVWNVQDATTVGNFGSYLIPAAPDNVYASGQLYKTITTDEQGRQVIEFKDKSGQVILKKVQIGTVTDIGNGSDHNPDNWICTYYIYDDFGSLRCVVQPEGVRWLNANGWNFAATDGATILAEQCFRYEYDQRRRMIVKQVPGAAPVYMVYDRRDRLVFTQDGNLRQKNQWLTTLYDGLNRPVMTGLVTYSAGREQLQIDVNNLTGSGANSNMETTQLNLPSFLVVASHTAGRVSYQATQTVELQPGFETNTGDQVSIEIVTDGGGISNVVVSDKPIPAGATFVPLTITRYDNYDWRAGTPLAGGFMANELANALPASNTNFPYARAVTPSTARLLGQVTGSQVRVLQPDGSLGAWLHTCNYYDDDARLIQVQKTNMNGAVETATTQYSFHGATLVSAVSLSVAGQTLRQQTSMQYDNLWRPVSINQQNRHTAIGEDQWSQSRPIATMAYDALGQVKIKKLGKKADGTDLESLTMEYNIRGWLLGINREFVNNINNGSRKAGYWFGFDLGYDKTSNSSTRAYQAPQFNGNISGQSWRSAGDNVARQYSYSYDAANRLMKADFVQDQGGWGKNFNFDSYMGDGNIAATAYDLNGNIKKMQQWGWTATNAAAQIDNIIYTYQAGSTSTQTYSNRLKAVTEGITASTGLGDFTDKSNTSDDYGYDSNGNLVTDLNKRINGSTGSNLTSGGAIAYNHLNLPTQIAVKKDDGSSKGTINYTYDASGAKLQKQTTETGVTLGSITGVTVTTTTHYLGGSVYESKTYSPLPSGYANYSYQLQFTGQPEGRIRAVRNNPQDDPASLVYDYFLKDHLGNVRMVLTEEVKKDEYPAATMESSKASTETLYYTQINETRVDRPANMPADGSTSPNDKAAVLSSAGQKIGPGILLKVQAGDELELWCRSWWQGSMGGQTNSDQTGVKNSLSSLLGNLMPGTSAGKITAAQAAGGSVFGSAILSFLQSKNPEQADRPKAYVNWLFLNDQFAYADNNGSGSESVSTANDYKLHERNLANSNTIKVKQSGYVYIYTSNESSLNVYFDNLKVNHIRGPLLEETHYYPFGLTMAGISSKAAGKLENKRKFNGIEHNTDLDLNQYDAFFRNADPQIGRWWQIDPKPNTSESPYSMMGNNPISKADPLGDTIKARGNFLQRLKINARLLIASTFSSSAREMIRDLKKSTHVHTIVMNKYIDASFSRPDNIAAALKKGTVFETQDQFGATTIMGTGLGTGTTITLAKRNKHQDINGGYTGTRTTALLHELFHSWSYNYGKGNREIDNSLKVEERQAVHWENVFRKQLGFLGIFGMPARAAYEDETNVMQNVYDPNFEQKAKESDPRKN